MIKKQKIKIISVLMLALNLSLSAQQATYPPVSKSIKILEGNKFSWDSNSVHTFSVVQANKDGYKYWAYYGLDKYRKDFHSRKCGLARSNDLKNWVKYDFNPVINKNCRWPTVVLSRNEFYMFYTEYNKENDSRIVMVNSKNGIDFGNKTIVVPYAKGHQNQNPFIYFNRNDSTYYLFYYSGTERAKLRKDKYWSITVKKSKDISKLQYACPNKIITSSAVIAAPSITFYNNRYYLLVEEFENYNKKNWKWVTRALWSDKIDGEYKRVTNNPVLSDHDACAFQYILNNKLYVFYSHKTDIRKGIWELRMIEVGNE